jgi:transcriptional regulator with XRE-family HTH domain
MHKRLKIIRKHFSLSQTAMSELTGTSLRAYQNYERGEREFPVDLLRALYESLKVDPVWVMTGAGPMILENKSSGSKESQLLDRVIAAVAEYKSMPKRTVTSHGEKHG